jgi:uncharacterized membrane protein
LMSRTRCVVALLGTAITLGQGLLIFFSGNGVCLNDGCQVVEELTRVSPLIFNLAGLLFFQAVFWSVLVAGRRDGAAWEVVPRVLLHAALCAEAVLVFFQWQIAGSFCSYCLIIFSCIVLLNVLFGMRHLAVGMVLFLAVLTGCSSLNWQSGGAAKTLRDGAFARLAGQQGSTGGYLFFSGNCSHCEEIIHLLREGNTCEIFFNPVDRVTEFSVPGAERTASYNLQINLEFLKLMSIDEIPVLVTSERPNSKVIRGTAAIEQYLSESCRTLETKDYSGFSSALPSSPFIMGTETLQEDGCPVNEDCEKKSP